MFVPYLVLSELHYLRLCLETYHISDVDNKRPSAGDVTFGHPDRG